VHLPLDARLDARRRPLLLLSLVLCVAVTMPQPARASQDPLESQRPAITEADIARAVRKMKDDPNLTAEKPIKMLKWKNAKTTKRSSGGFAWLDGLFRWINQSSRMLVWVALALLLGLLFLYFMRLVGRYRRPRAQGSDFIAPTHVRDLDIRPETLPHDIGAAARRLWDDGEQRAALALLYRGLLSRLAHVHRVPIRDSSTEGDCLALAARHLAPNRRDYAASLVRVWQRAVYGREDVQTPTIYSLCDQFAASLDARDARDPMEAGGVA
jgi:hypothetical protein